MEILNYNNTIHNLLNSFNIKASCVFIRHNNKVLSVSRKYDKNDKGLPGGKVEQNETYEECALREVKEETGLIIFSKNIIPIFSACGDTGLFPLKQNECNCVTFYTEIFEGEINTNENGKVEWVNFEELTNGTFSAYNSKVIDIIKKKN